MVFGEQRCPADCTATVMVGRRLLMAAVEAPAATTLQCLSGPGAAQHAAGHVPLQLWSQPNLILPCCCAQWLTEALKDCEFVPQRENPNSVAPGARPEKNQGISVADLGSRFSAAAPSVLQRPSTK